MKGVCYPSESGVTNKLILAGDSARVDEMVASGTIAFSFPGVQIPYFRTAVFSGDGALVAINSLEEYATNTLKLTSTKAIGGN